ncbi:MAG: amino acid--tRNA ligase-related protein, partial [Balneolaceae bacterium]
MKQEKVVSISVLKHHTGEIVTLKGWVYNIRTSKKLIFIEVRDGSGICQTIVSADAVRSEVWETALQQKQESSIVVSGLVVADERSAGGVELHIERLLSVHIAEDYPITPKEHGVEFLMENRHLWLRSRRQWAVMRVRSQIVYTLHRFFQEREFVQLDAPVFTANAAEGTTTLFETDYFERKAYLTQSGQLYAEAMAMAHGKVYTFGPTFRAEKSNTRRHLTEFWMVEPEMAFYDLPMNMNLAEELVRYLLLNILRECEEELKILERDTAQLQKAVENPFVRLTYSEAVERLRSSETTSLLETMEEERLRELQELQSEHENLEEERGEAKKWRKSQIDERIREIHSRKDQIEEDLRNLPDWAESAATFQWGNDFGGSDETVLTLQFNSPVIVHRYPSAIKAFYMKRDPDDDSLALAMDI